MRPLRYRKRLDARWPAACFLLALVVAGHPAAADQPWAAEVMPGDRVTDVLQEVRSLGYPLAWSSRLVPDELRVIRRSRAGKPLPLLSEILAPHGLELRRVEGILLVARVRSDTADGQPGRVLVIVRDERAQLVTSALSVRSDPDLGRPEALGNGIFEFLNAEPGRYRLTVEGDAFEPATRTLNVASARLTSLHVRLEPKPAMLEDLTVSTSRYVLFDNSRFFIDQRAIEHLPDIGDDPIRAAHRLPGTAAGGWSSPAFFRGGEKNETAIYLNGLKLLDPFHVRDFHNVFSAIDARTISGVEAYTGGFPALYGDRMSGVLLLRSERPDEPRHYELGLSVFNTSLLASGYRPATGSDWLVSARRSNLDLVLDRREHGEPSYVDLFAEFSVELSARSRARVNALLANDRILVVTEDDPAEDERATSDTSNQSFWVQLETHWSERLYSQTVASYRALDNERDGVLNDVEQLIGNVTDDREVDILGIRQDWEMEVSDRHLVRWGWEFLHETADYHYQATADYAGFYLAYPGVPERLDRQVRAAPSGDSWSVYVSDRWRLTPKTTLEGGLRWDRQTWPGPAGGSQWSPRLSFLHALSETADLRLTWGVYHQAQGIQNLQVEDGVDRFFPAQEARHLIAGLKFRLGKGHSLRLEAYDKDYRDPRPRFENLLDPLALIPELEPDRIRIAPQTARARGLEVTLEHEGSSGLNWWASYVWSEVEDRIDGRRESRNWDQRHSLQAGLSWEPSAWALGVAVKLHSGWPTTSAYLFGEDEESARLVFGPRNSEQLNTFFNLDARVSRSWGTARGQLTVFFEVTNLTNRKNECCADYDAEFDEENGAAPVLERSVDHWLGLTPAIGLLWEF